MGASRANRILNAFACCALGAYFVYEYGPGTGAWVFGSLVYVVFLFLVFPVAWQVRIQGVNALHWLDWARLAYVPIFASLAMKFAPWLPLLAISALGLGASLFVFILGLWADRANSARK